MKIDTREMEKLHASSSGATRTDLYVGIHKAMRALMSDILVAVGRMDPEDESEFEWVSSRVLQLADFCTAHLTHENEFVHVAMETCQPGSSERVGQEHQQHATAIARLKTAMHQMRSGQGEQRAREALSLYRQLALFVAHNFEHMHVEEAAHNQVLWAQLQRRGTAGAARTPGGLAATGGEPVRAALDGPAHDAGRAAGGAGRH